MRKKWFFILACCGHMAHQTPADASLPVSEITIVGGWRHDNIKSDLNIQIPRGTPTAFDDLTAQDLQIWQIGVKGVAAYPRCWADGWGGGAWWLNQFYLRGEACWGREHNHGKYREATNSIPAAGVDNVTKAHAVKSRTEDYDIAVGWLFPFCCDALIASDGLGIGPVLGYSSDRQKFKLQNVFNATSKTSKPALDGTKFSSKWGGPWLGVDAYYRNCGFTFALGYEYHWTFWHGEFTVPKSAAGSGFVSDRRKADGGYGNVVRIEAIWNLWNCWELGASCKYRYFKTRNGEEVPVGGFVANGFPANEFDEAEAQWENFEAALNIGCRF